MCVLVCVYVVHNACVYMCMCVTAAMMRFNVHEHDMLFGCYVRALRAVDDALLDPVTGRRVRVKAACKRARDTGA